MLTLPWWVLGTSPDEDEDEDEVIEESTHEVQESLPSTPISMFRTPSSTPNDKVFKAPLPISIPDSSTVRKVAKRLSQTLESASPKMRKTDTNKSFERKETEVMDKSGRDEEDGLFDHGDHDETFRLLDSVYPHPESSTSVLDKSDESFAEKSIVPHLDANGNEESFDVDEQNSIATPPPREFPMFFTSFNDTTVLFNTTIAGDYDAERHQKDDAVGDWIFKGNKMLETKSPAETTKVTSIPDASLKNKRKPRGKSVGNQEKSSRRRRINKKTMEDFEKPVVSPSIPTLSVRKTPSRRAKTYKSLKEMD
uniref:Uncharacterized protein n=1 Tax=Caenorhabditis japonica TaxID=281687 RepID=A0A8R1I1H4_CAEJA